MNMWQVSYNGEKIGFVKALDYDEALDKGSELCKLQTTVHSSKLHGQMIDEALVIVTGCVPTNYRNLV